MEIEKKYLVTEVPENLESYDKWEIEQAYLCSDPVIRVRKKNEEYILTYKSRRSLDEREPEEQLCVSEEAELPLTRKAYEKLRGKRDGRCITKTRYRIPYGNYLIELDLFHGDYEGFVLAEVEFGSAEESRAFAAPEWFGRDVSGDYHYTNAYLAGK